MSSPAVRIVLSGPGKNALSTDVMARTLAAVRAAGDAPLFVTGEGDAFSAGLNLKEVASLDVAGMTRFLGVLEELVKALYEHPAPVVAWINGHAIAGGCVLALTADHRVMTTTAGSRIGLNEVVLGLRFPPVTFEMVRRRLAGASLERVLLEGGLYESDRALRLGLVDEVGSEADAVAALERLSASPASSFARLKHMLRGTIDIPEAEQRSFLEETIPDWTSPARREALLSVLKPKK